jgi:hypothetical protein
MSGTQDGYTSGMERSISVIAEKLGYSEALKRLMQVTRVNQDEQFQFSILYALNEGKLQSRVIDHFLFAYLGMANSRKGKSRAELIDLVKAATPNIPKGWFGRIKETLDLE